MTDFQTSVSGGRMGRPPLNVIMMSIRLSAVARARIETLVGKNHVAAFVRQAVENELQRVDPEGKSIPKPAEKKPRAETKAAADSPPARPKRSRKPG